MPRLPDRKQAVIVMTAEQYDITRALAGDEGMATYIRRLVAVDAARRGVTWPDNLLQRGTYPRR